MCPCVDTGEARLPSPIHRSLGQSRAQFLPPKGPGGAAFVDLFAGPGRARVVETGGFIDGSPLLALKHANSPFTRVILCEKEPENRSALERRTEPYGVRSEVLRGDCNDRVDDVVKLVPRYGLNIALIDPYNVSPLSFSTIEKLGRVGRMDLLIHFPTSDLRRKLGKGWKDYVDRFLGTSRWRSSVKKPEQVPQLIPILREQLTTLGYLPDEVRSEPVKADTGLVLSHIVYASKHKLGSDIWQAITRIRANGQRRMF